MDNFGFDTIFTYVANYMDVFGRRTDDTIRVYVEYPKTPTGVINADPLMCKDDDNHIHVNLEYGGVLPILTWTIVNNGTSCLPMGGTSPFSQDPTPAWSDTTLKWSNLLAGNPIPERNEISLVGVENPFRS